LTAYLRRLRSLTRRRNFDIVWIEGELFPWIPTVCESLLTPRIPVLVDYDDAIFHKYDLHPSLIVRHILGAKIDAVMRRATMVVAGNEYLADRARSAGAERVAVIPTAVDTTRYRLDYQPPPTFTLGWIGTPTTASYLQMLHGPVLEARATVPLCFRVIGSAKVPDIVDDTLPWSEEIEPAMGRLFSAGVMPLPNSPWELGKCGYKLIQYMACGLPVIASPVGANRQIVVDGETGILAETDSDWRAAIERLRADPVLCRRFGEAGRQRVERFFSIRVCAPMVYEALSAAASAR